MPECWGWLSDFTSCTRHAHGRGGIHTRSGHFRHRRAQDAGRDATRTPLIHELAAACSKASTSSFTSIPKSEIVLRCSEKPPTSSPAEQLSSRGALLPARQSWNYVFDVRDCCPCGLVCCYEWYCTITWFSSTELVLDTPHQHSNVSRVLGVEC